MPRLTPEQEGALALRHVSVALSAGAGCGKTSVLTERFVAAISGEPRVPLDRIAALTFTDKAAAELRGRVRQACRDRLDAGDDPLAWRGVLRGLEAAPIGTFHTFCGGIVRRFAVRAGVDPGFTILDPTIAATCRDEAVEAALRACLSARDGDLHEMAVTLGLDRVRAILQSLLADRSAETLDQWAGFEPAKLVDLWESEWECRGKPAALRGFIEKADRRLEPLQAYDCGHHPVMKARRAALLALLPTLASARDPVATLAEAVELAKVQGGGAAGQWPSLAVYESIKNALTKFRDDVKSLILDLDFDPAATALAAEQGLRLARLGVKARAEYARRKRAQGALDFDDLLLKARDLLRDDASTVRDELRRQYDLILVDEFQDTDPVQDAIVRDVAGADLADGRLFLVGDFKQSIYGFRGAAPALFTRHRAEFPAEGQRPLTRNFRSRPAILDFVNALFADAFEGYEPLTPGRSETLPAGEPAVVLAWPESRGGEDGGRDERRVDRRRSEEAGRLARLIRSWIAEERPVVDKETNLLRPMRAGDVAILFRANDVFQPYEQALDDVGLDYHLIGGPGFFTRPEVVDLINVLAAVDNPRDALALAGALRSPFFALSDEALFWLATVETGDLAAGLARSDEATLPDLRADDRRRAERAARLLGRWRSFKDREPIAALVDRVLDESGFEAALLGESLGDRKRANARKLVKKARAFDAGGGFTLADFVARLRADLDGKPREDQASTTDETGNAVRLMTIHKAKGLEFPVVVVPDLERTRSGAPKPFVLDPLLGPLVPKAEAADEDDTPGAATKSLGWLVHTHLQAAEDEAEALRVVYVATTRARDRLVLSVAGDPDRLAHSPALDLLLDRFNPADGSCRPTLPDGWPVPTVTVIQGTPPTGSRSGSRSARRSRRRPPLRAIARLIETTVAANAGRASVPPATLGPTALPSFLSLDPARNRSGPAARLDRLVRAILLDPRAVRRGGLDAVAAVVGRRESPAASGRLVAMATERLRHWVEGPLGRELASAEEIRADVAWSVAWPVEAPGSTVIEGRLDLAFRDPSAGWRLLQVSDAEAPPAFERLRLLLSAHLAPRLGLGPIERAWHLRHGPDGGLSVEDAFDVETITACLRSAVMG